MGKKKIKSSPPGCQRKKFGSKEIASDVRAQLEMSKKFLRLIPDRNLPEGPFGKCLFLHDRAFVSRFHGPLF